MVSRRIKDKSGGGISVRDEQPVDVLTSTRMRIQVNNRFSASTGYMISGLCTFYYKTVPDEKYVDKETVPAVEGAVPGDAFLTFLPRKETDRLCVGAFELIITVHKPGARDETRDPLIRAHQKGKRWKYAEYDYRF